MTWPGLRVVRRLEQAAGKPMGTARRGMWATQDRPARQHILFLDDDESLVLLARRMLERLGYGFSGFTRAADALQAFREDPSRFDFAITDFNMPGASGVDVAAELLRLRADLPVALLTGLVTEELRQEAHGVGIRHVLRKPNTVAAMAEVIHGLAGESGVAPGSS